MKYAEKHFGSRICRESELFVSRTEISTEHKWVPSLLITHYKPYIHMYTLPNRIQIFFHLPFRQTNHIFRKIGFFSLSRIFSCRAFFFLLTWFTSDRNSKSIQQTLIETFYCMKNATMYDDASGEFLESFQSFVRLKQILLWKIAVKILIINRKHFFSYLMKLCNLF